MSHLQDLGHSNVDISDRQDKCLERGGKDALYVHLVESSMQPCQFNVECFISDDEHREEIKLGSFVSLASALFPVITPRDRQTASASSEPMSDERQAVRAARPESAHSSSSKRDDGPALSLEKTTATFPAVNTLHHHSGASRFPKHSLTASEAFGSLSSV